MNKKVAISIKLSSETSKYYDALKRITLVSSNGEKQVFLNSEVKGGTMLAYTDNVSTFVISSDRKASTNFWDYRNPNLYYSFGLVIILAFGVFVAIFISHKRKQKNIISNDENILIGY